MMTDKQALGFAFGWIAFWTLAALIFFFTWGEEAHAQQSGLGLMQPAACASPGCDNLATETQTQPTPGPNTTNTFHKEVVVMSYTHAKKELFCANTTFTNGGGVESAWNGCYDNTGTCVGSTCSGGTYNGNACYDNSQCLLDCVSTIVTADAQNLDTVWVLPFASPTPAVNAGIPLYPGTRQSFRAPNSGDCGDMMILGGPLCVNAGDCKVYVVTQ